MNLYPIMIDLSEKNVTLIGGGDVAMRKATDLIEAGAVVKIISPEFSESLKKMNDKYPDKSVIIKRKYEKGDLEGAFMVFSATDDPVVNKEVYDEAQEKNIFINAVDDPPNCSFFIPSFTRRGDLILSLSTSGASPSMAARLRRELEESLPENIEDILRVLRKAREMLKEDPQFGNLDFEKRGAILKRIVSDDKVIGRLMSSYRQNSLDLFLMSQT